jgi:uncharacterized membrane protein YphA (DoxX/SURF4 family)
MDGTGVGGVAAAVLLVLRLCIAGAFIRAGAVKLTGLREFRLAVANYQILPASLVGAAAVAVPLTEVTAGVLLLLGVFPAIVAAVLAALLLGFSAAMAANLARGRVFDCGCGGDAVPRLISWPHVAVNIALAAMATVLAIAPPASLELFRGASGTVTIAAPAGAGIPLMLAAALCFVVTRMLTSAARARRSLRAPRAGSLFLH